MTQAKKFGAAAGLLASMLVTLALTGCASSPSQRSTGQVVDDSVVTTRVKTALIGNDETKARQIDVETYRGAVQLNGFVDTEASRTAAVATARSIEGVQSVKDNLQIRAADRSAGQVVDDTLISTKVKTALIADSRTKGYQIEVATNDGIVELGGFVDSAEAKQAAADLASKVEGVNSVRNRLQLRQ
jgi:hyperosmotically inducible protein